MGLLDRLRGTPEDRFANQVMAAVRAAGIADVWYDRDQFAIGYRRAPGEQPGRGFLTNVYRESEDDTPAERDERIQRYVSIVFDKDDMPTDWPSVRPQLRTVLRGVTFGLFSQSGTTATLSRPVLPFLDEYVVIDLPTSMAYVLAEQPATWGVPADEVFAAARENVADFAALDEPGGEPGSEPAVLRFVDSGDDYFVSRLLLDGWLAALEPRVGGRPVAFIPDSNTLVVVADGPRLDGVFDLVEREYGDAPRCLSPAAYTVDPHGRLVPYLDSAAARRAAVILAVEEYGAQAHWLTQRYGDSLHIGALLAAARPDGSVFMSATWTDGVDALMPRAEYVGFVRLGGDEPFHVPWHVVAAEVGLGPVPDLVPERFRVTGWPPEPVLARLRLQAVEP